MGLTDFQLGIPSSLRKRTSNQVCSYFGQPPPFLTLAKRRSKGKTAFSGNRRSSPTDQPQVPLIVVTLALAKAARQSAKETGERNCSAFQGIRSSRSFQGHVSSKSLSRCQNSLQPERKNDSKPQDPTKPQFLQERRPPSLTLSDPNVWAYP